MPAPKTCTEPDPSESNEAWETGKCEEGSAKTKDKRRENAMRKTSPGSEEATVLPPPESLLQRVCRDMSQTRKYVKMYMASAEAIAEKDKLIETLKSDISFTRMQEMKAELDVS
ncbi:hypothetical protein TGPRC2_356700 [Toxoplasma gondii TgCatPRC2]|uniref:Uncharacterized protein n=5 Tax=Toxoplasma gondii TaxID=5811 RepID=A0A151HN27_TOXGO|nr:hypothetical protein TGRH88_066860 [Toxoplasma gondii]KYF40876.1 hypothetical protein TGARI_356700 [Toxoplasma gondii ARI]KYK70797.1 hypothetical protein TGPRC2_356700 [Toxoplasma gondii TgCatPRC2]PUA90000.1 hypothetical protein TGBR9_356700 [Toxoplasma gondii TgCATBr9]RQX71065.1 hypothetical protein TGCAST_356700 [Toxoplasma gondii CAST]